MASEAALGEKKRQPSRSRSDGPSWKSSYPCGPRRLQGSWSWSRGCRGAITRPIKRIERADKRTDDARGAAWIIFGVENSSQGTNATAKVPSSEVGGDRRFYDHGREPYTSQAQAVTASVSTSRFKSELNDAIGLYSAKQSFSVFLRNRQRGAV